LIQAILFDLDSVLFIGDQTEFMRNYTGLLSPRFSQLMPSDKFAKQLLRSLDVMVKDPKPERTNLQTFYDDLSKATGLTANTLRPIFEEFYTNDFPALQCMSKVNTEGPRVVECAVQQEYLTALIANPVLPMIAIRELIKWAEIPAEQFAVISSIEEFHYSSPHQGFFAEMAEKLNLHPSECLLVSSKPIENPEVRKLGLRIFLLADSADDKDESFYDYLGRFADLQNLLLNGSR
jgi:putative hydrolase of the HAD superfamily